MSESLIVAVITSLIAAVAAVAVAVIEARSAKSRKLAEARALQRQEESRLSMKLMNATCALSLVCAKKLTGQHTNGDVAEAIKDAKDAKSDYQDFMNKVTASQVSKL